MIEILLVIIALLLGFIAYCLNKIHSLIDFEFMKIRRALFIIKRLAFFNLYGRSKEEKTDIAQIMETMGFNDEEVFRDEIKIEEEGRLKRQKEAQENFFKTFEPYIKEQEKKKKEQDDKKDHKKTK